MHLFRLLPVTILGLLALAACHGGRPAAGSGSTVPNGASAAAYQQSLDGWLNRSEADLVAAWGVPERSQRLTDGGQALQYVRTGAEGKILCTTLFTSDMTGMIRTWTYRGSDCGAPRLGEYGPS